MELLFFYCMHISQLNLLTKTSVGLKMYFQSIFLLLTYEEPTKCMELLIFLLLAHIKIRSFVLKQALVKYGTFKVPKLSMYGSYQMHRITHLFCCMHPSLLNPFTMTSVGGKKYFQPPFTLNVWGTYHMHKITHFFWYMHTSLLNPFT
jgi:hypothetical protein